MLGVAVTLVPWVTILLATQTVGSTGTGKPLPRSVDIANGIVFFLFTGIIEAAFLLAPFVIAVWRRPPGISRRDGMRALGMRAVPFRQAFVWIVVGLGAILAATLLYQVLITVLHLPLQTNGDVLAQRAKDAPFTTLGALAGAVLIAPFCEEVFFRGFTFAGFLKGMPVWLAMVLSAILFGISHGDIGSLAPLIVFGVVVALARWRTGSIWPGVVIHTGNNLLAALAIVAVILR